MKRVAPQGLLFCVLFYFAYHLLEGNRGLSAWVRLRSELAAAQEERAEIAAERAVLEHRVRLLRPGTLDPDLLDEQARRLLNLGRNSDLLVLRPAPGLP